MGLDVSHDAFSGAYGAFDRWRSMICRATGGSWSEAHGGDWYWGEGFSADTHPGLRILLNHSDCDGEIAPTTALRLADELEALLPAIELLDDNDDGRGHIAAQGGYAAVTRKFIAGCRAAGAAGEPLEFL